MSSRGFQKELHVAFRSARVTLVTRMSESPARKSLQYAGRVF
jgi:hypothetical protein